MSEKNYLTTFLVYVRVRFVGTETHKNFPQLEVDEGAEDEDADHEDLCH